MNIEIESVRCRRCRHQWVPRKSEVRVCPKCHSPYWDRPRAAPEKRAFLSSRSSGGIEAILKEMVRRIIKVADPEKIILFGSHATGHARPDSDLDLLVVARVKDSLRKKATEIDTALLGIPLAVDTVVVTPEQIEKWREVPGSIIHAAVSQGRALYDQAA